MKLLLIALLVVVVGSAVAAEEEEPTTDACPTAPITVAGADSLRRLTEAWKVDFLISKCPNAEIQIEGGGSFVGAARVCGTHNSLVAVDIGGMARRFNYGDATTDSGWSYQCQRSPRKAIELAVAQEGIAIVTTAKGVAADCIKRLGGLSLDQLRWIYSVYTRDELINEEWDESSVPNSDGNDDTHLWSELHEDCAAVEIALSGVEESDPSYRFFIDVVFEGRDETFDFNRTTTTNTPTFYSSSSVQDLASHVQNNTAGISYFQLGLLFSTELRKTIDTLEAISIKHRGGELVDPKAAAFENLDYPLSRTLYLNVVDDNQQLPNMKSFLEFGLGDEGTEIIKASGFWPIHDWERIVMATRAQTAGGIPMSEIQQSCGPAGGHISMAGSTTVLPIARIWSEIYKLGCPDVATVLEGGGSSVGAGRVCANPEKGEPVDIGNMSRGWKPSEGVEQKEDPDTYDCLEGDTTRSIVQVDVAQDGITFIMQKGGEADVCVQILGGLTLDQLRWIYSGSTEDELEKNGWDPKSLKNSDGNDETHLWSELDARCQPSEIRLAGDYVGDGTYTNFVNIVMNGEDVDEDRPYGYVVGEGFVLASYLRQYGDAISYAGFNYYFDNQDSISAAPIQNGDGVFISPSKAAISDGSYNPFVRKIWMNLLHDEESLQDTVPMVKFGFEHPKLVAATGYVPLTRSDSDAMIDRLAHAKRQWGDQDGDSASLGLILGLVIAGAVGVVVGVMLFFYFMNGSGKKEGSSSDPSSDQAMVVE